MSKIREFILTSNLSTKINKFLGHWAYLILVGSLYIVSWTFKYISPNVSLIVNMVFSCLLLVFSLLFSKNVKSFFPIFLFFMISLPILPVMGALHWSLMVSGYVAAVCTILFVFKKLFFMGGIRFGIGPFNITFFIMVICMIISYIINATSGEYFHQYVGGGAALLVILVGIFVLSVVSFICYDPDESTFKKDYLFHIFIVLSYFLILQFVINAIAQAAAGVDFHSYLDTIGWGNRNTFGKLGCICMTFLYFKLIKNPRKYFYLIITYIAVFACVSLVNSRGTLGFSAVLTMVLMIDSLMRFKKYFLELLLCYAVAIFIIYALIITVPEIKNLFSRFFDEQYNLNGRDVIWDYVIKDTFTTPIRITFGGSTIFLFEMSPLMNNFPGNTFLLCHSTFFTYLACLGVVGIFVFVAHSTTQLYQCFKYFKSDDRLILLIVVILGITYGIIDNTNFEFVYSIPLIFLMATGAKENQPMLVVGENKRLQVIK